MWAVEINLLDDHGQHAVDGAAILVTTITTGGIAIDLTAAHASSTGASTPPSASGNVSAASDSNDSAKPRGTASTRG